MRATGSANTVNTSSNGTPCFLRFSRAFVASHSNSGVVSTLTGADAVHPELPWREHDSWRYCKAFPMHSTSSPRGVCAFKDVVHGIGRRDRASNRCSCAVARLFWVSTIRGAWCWGHDHAALGWRLDSAHPSSARWIRSLGATESRESTRRRVQSTRSELAAEIVYTRVATDRMASLKTSAMRYCCLTPHAPDGARG